MMHSNDTTAARTAEITRATAETDIRLTLTLDGTGRADIHTGIGFFDHMLDGFSRHGLFDLTVHAEGDLQVDSHHTIEDTGIVLGQVLCAVDLSGRPYLQMDTQFTVDRLGDMDTEMVREFFYAISYAAGMNLHFKMLTSGNNHHMAEAMFKAFAKALDAAVAYDPRISDVLSTKGSL